MCGFTQNNCRCQCAGLMRQTMLNTFKGYFDQFLFILRGDSVALICHLILLVGGCKITDLLIGCCRVAHSLIHISCNITKNH